ncbi:MAG: gliding motility protein GldM [Bacteroidales bacterium]|nr:gliding motility protein GldM [Bacteroidales bacterium]
MAENITRLSPRQRMINLMYIVLTAMLALNVSSDVLDGFTQVEEGLNRTNENIEQRNNAIYHTLEDFAKKNPEKGKSWYDKASEVRSTSAKLYHHIDSLKQLIVHVADGEDGDVNNIQRRDDLEAAAIVMLSPTTKRGAELRASVDNYRNYISTILTDPIKRENVIQVLSTASITRNGITQNWENSKFENQPVVAAITLLAKLQNDIKYAEGEALAHLLTNVDAGDVRVNELNAFVIPDSRIVMRGGKYSARIVLAAVDTTQRPTIVIGKNQISNGLYEFSTNKTGVFDYSGYLEVPRGDGSIARHDFKSSYTVIEPAATVSATMMNVLYAGIENPISISVPGIPTQQVSASMTNGSLTRKGDTWIARPTNVGSDAVITVTATIDGRSQTVNTTTFRVRKLPNPTPFIAFNDANGNPDKYLGGKPFAKVRLLQAPGLGAAIDDGLLNISFTVLSFETVFFDSMGNAMPEVSDGANFSSRQKEQIKRLSRGKRFYISRIKAKGPDGITRDLSPLEVIVN